MFGHHSQHPLPADAVLVDEASMVDLPLAAALLDAAPRPGRTFQLVLVGACTPPCSHTPFLAQPRYRRSG